MSHPAQNAASPARCSRTVESPQAIVSASGLPDELATLVISVARSCRLWKRERAEVARELCAHFLDGLESGVSPAELADSFGDTKRSAHLITRAKRRLRPAWWLAWRVVSRSIASASLLLVLCYGLLAARYFLGSPSVRHNYAAEANALILASPDSDRAWPLYVDAVRQFVPVPEFVDSGEPLPKKQGDPNFEALEAYLTANQQALESVRAAADRPIIGYVYSSVIDPDYARAMAATRPGYTYDPSLEKAEENPLLMGVLLPYLGEMRRFARCLRLDMRIAAAHGDFARFERDEQALLGMSQQCLQEQFFIGQLVGVAIAELAVDAVLAHAGDPFLAGADRAPSLAHRLAALGGGRIRMTADGERVMVEDLAQRFYSDDGDGGGRVVCSGLDQTFFESWGLAKPRCYGVLQAIRPVQSVLLPSRSTLNAMTERFVTTFARDESLPPWLHAQRSSDAIFSEIMEIGFEPLSPVIRSLRGGSEDGRPLAAGFAARDRFEASRSAALTALALGIYRSTHGNYPAALEELVPSLLPSLPVDPFDGRPMRYVRPETPGAMPLLYSVGADRTDDHGRAPATRVGRQKAAQINSVLFGTGTVTLSAPDQALQDSAKGDWVLWPQTDDH